MSSVGPHRCCMRGVVPQAAGRRPAFQVCEAPPQRRHVCYRLRLGHFPIQLAGLRLDQSLASVPSVPCSCQRVRLLVAAMPNGTRNLHSAAPAPKARRTQWTPTRFRSSPIRTSRSGEAGACAAAAAAAMDRLMPQPCAHAGPFWSRTCSRKGHASLSDQEW
jgi:hypothetical protein